MAPVYLAEFRIASASPEAQVRATRDIAPPFPADLERES